MDTTLNEITESLVYIENAILNSSEYNATSIEKKIDKLFEVVNKKSEKDKGVNTGYVSDYLTWRKKVKSISKNQSESFEEILSSIKLLVKDSERALKGKKVPDRPPLDEKKFTVLFEELKSSFDQMKSLVPEAAILKYRSDLIDMHYKSQASFIRSSFFKTTISFFSTILFFCLSFVIADSLETRTETKLGYSLLTAQKLLISAVIYFVFDRLLEVYKYKLKWWLISKYFKDLKAFVNLVFYKDQAIVNAYQLQIEKLNEQHKKILNDLKDTIAELSNRS